jgi:DNA repair/transcription protein MET18/MMS19
VSSYSITLWDTLKYEILNAQEEDLAEEALLALRAIAERLSENSSTAPTSLLAQYLRPIMKECNDSLQEPQQKQAKPTGKIASSLAAASAAAYYLVVKAALAPLLTIYQDTDGHSKQRSLLEVLVALFDSAIEVFGSWGARTAVQSLGNPLDPFHDRLQELFSQALMSTNKEEVSFRMVALKGLLRLASIRNFLQENEIGLIVQYLNEIVLVEESYSRDELKQEAIRGLAEISKSKPQLIKDITFPTFMAKLPDSDLEPSDYLTTLEGLAQISVEKDLFNTLIRRLLSKLDVVLTGTSSPAYPRAILSTIVYVFEREGIDNDPILDTYYTKIVARLFRQAALPMAYHEPSTTLNDDTVLDVLGSLGALIVCSLPKEKQKEASNHVYELFCPENEGSRPETFFLTRQLENHRYETMVLSTYLLAALPRDFYPPESISNRPLVLQDLFDTLFSVGIKITGVKSPATILATHRQLALLANKFMIPTFTEYILEHLQGLIQDVSSSPQQTPEYLLKIRQTFHLARALICRLIPQTRNLLYSLLDLVCNSTAEVSIPSAHGFALLLAEDPILIPKNGFTIRLLFKQKVFTTLVPEISQRFRSATTPLEKSNLLIALSGILAHTPQSVILPELTTLLPLLLQSLDLEVEDPSHSVKNATLETLTLVVREAPTAIDESGHTTSLVNRLLKTASLTLPASAKVSKAVSTTSAPANPSTPCPPHTRLLALMLLSLFPTHLKQPSLLPLKAKLLRGLERCADDPKRNVRREAVICRTKWLGMDEPEDDD